MIKELTMEKASLPDGWEMKKLIELGEVQTGTTPPTRNKEFYGAFIPFVKPPHFKPNGTISFSSSGLSKIGLTKGRLIKKNSILMVCIGASIGKTGITLIPISCNQQINAFTPNEKCLPKFYYHLLSSDYFFKKVMKRSSQATLPMINKTKWQNIEIPLPPLPQQKQIVAILDKAFAAIDTAKANAAQNLQNAKELFESYLQNVFENRWNDWEEKRLDEICEITSKLIDPKESQYQEFIHIGAGNIVSEKGTLVDLKTAKAENLISGKFLFDESMVLYSKIRPYLKKIVKCDFKGLCSADIYPLVPFKDKMTQSFLCHLLSSYHFTEYAIEGSQRAGMPKVNRKHLFAYSFYCPSIKEQEKIVQKLDSLSAETKKLEAIYKQKIADLEELKKSVLQKAFSGQLITLS
jgi:type I restriction enzyme S subunit